MIERPTVRDTTEDRRSNRLYVRIDSRLSLLLVALRVLLARRLQQSILGSTAELREHAVVQR